MQLFRRSTGIDLQETAAGNQVKGLNQQNGY